MWKPSSRRPSTRAVLVAIESVGGGSSIIGQLRLPLRGALSSFDDRVEMQMYSSHEGGPLAKIVRKQVPGSAYR